MTEGYVLVAIGDKYLQLAQNLIETLRLHGDNREVFVLTEPDMDDLYRSARTNFERFGTIPKITLNRYLPFDHNIFVDADCLCSASTDHVWEFFKSNDQFIQQFGTAKNDPRFTLHNISQYEGELGYSIPKVHGGIIYINKNTMNEDFFLWMQEELFPNYLKYLHNTGYTYKGSRPDQEIYSLAHGKFGLHVWEIWEQDIISIISRAEEIPVSKPFFRGKFGEDMGRNIPFIHVFEGDEGLMLPHDGTQKLAVSHYRKLYNDIINVQNS